MRCSATDSRHCNPPLLAEVTLRVLCSKPHPLPGSHRAPTTRAPSFRRVRSCRIQRSIGPTQGHAARSMGPVRGSHRRESQRARPVARADRACKKARGVGRCRDRFPGGQRRGPALCGRQLRRDRQPVRAHVRATVLYKTCCLLGTGRKPAPRSMKTKRAGGPPTASRCVVRSSSGASSAIQVLIVAWSKNAELTEPPAGYRQPRRQRR